MFIGNAAIIAFIQRKRGLLAATVAPEERVLSLAGEGEVEHKTATGITIVPDAAPVV